MRVNRNFSDAELVRSLERLPERQLREVIAKIEIDQSEALKALDQVNEDFQQSGLSVEEFARLADISEDEMKNLGLK